MILLGGDSRSRASHFAGIMGTRIRLDCSGVLPYFGIRVFLFPPIVGNKGTRNLEAVRVALLPGPGRARCDPPPRARAAPLRLVSVRPSTFFVDRRLDQWRGHRTGSAPACCLRYCSISIAHLGEVSSRPWCRRRATRRVDGVHLYDGLGQVLADAPLARQRAEALRFPEDENGVDGRRPGC